MDGKVIAPSILTADFASLREEIGAAVTAGCQLLHLDIMDGHLVPNLTIGPAIVKSLRQQFPVPFDLHLMVQDPEKFLEPFAKANGQVPGSIFTFHYEAVPEPKELIRKIREQGFLVGMAINPGTTAEVVFPYLSLLDMVLVMTVEPGYGGQGMMEICLPKIERIRTEAIRQGQDIRIEVDGGVKLSNISKVAAADILVMGSAIFREETDEAGKPYRSVVKTKERFCEAARVLKQLSKSAGIAPEEERS